MSVPAEVLPARLRPGGLWWLLALTAWPIGGYALALQDGRAAQNTVPGAPWVDEVHFAAGGLALMVGVFGFRRDLLVRAPRWHRRLGEVYVAAVAASGLASLAMACFASGGLAARLGFTILAVAWLATTALGLWLIKRGAVAKHRAAMVRSYAFCFAAVVLRVELPLLVVATGSFAIAYPIVAWACWVPNWLVAEWWLRRTNVRGERR